MQRILKKEKYFLVRSDMFLKLEIIKKIMGLIILSIIIPLGVYAMALGTLFSGLISSFINAYHNLKLLNYSYIEQRKNIIPSLLISLMMGALVYTFKYLSIANWKILLLQIILGGVSYIALAKIFKIECFDYLIQTIKDIFENKRN